MSAQTTDHELLTPGQYHEILEAGISSILASADLETAPVPCDIGDASVIAENENVLLLRPDDEWPFCFRLRRNHTFGDDDIRVLKQLLKALREKLTVADKPFFPYLLSKCPQDVVAWTVQHRDIDDSLLPFILTTLLKWASQTYEGSPISVAIGVDHRPDASSVSNTHLSYVTGKDFAKVLSNGLDTLLVVSPSGHIVTHSTLSASAPELTRRDATYAPRRYYSLAQWARGNRVVVALNNHGELLVFHRQKLTFAYRHGAWFHFSHVALVRSISLATQDQLLARAIYDTCMDVSFARAGGCLVVVKPEHAGRTSKYLDKADLLQDKMTEKSSVLRHLTGVPFRRIPRPLRHELAAMDGATIVDEGGNVSAAGAIVKIPGGSEGGGRRAAAKALSRLGLAIKISSDGGITAFTDGGTKANPDVAFEVCT